MSSLLKKLAAWRPKGESVRAEESELSTPNVGNVPPSPLESATPLEELNAAAATLIYRPLSRGEIRLITLHPGARHEDIRCSAGNVAHGTDTPYDALSYVWGSHAEPEAIYLNGSLFRVTRNLHEALLHIRNSTDDRVLWIDALAINQSDSDERSAQVMKMRHIYSLATTVVVWLGPATVALDFVFDMINLAPPSERDDFFQRLNDLTDNSKSAVAWALNNVAQLPYWQRVWVIQEIMYARDVVIFFGSRRLKYSELFAFWDAAGDFARPKASDLALVSTVIVNVMCDDGPNAMPSPGSGRDGTFINIEQWLKLIGRKKCTDPRDRVFAFHGCFPPDIRSQIFVDYSLDNIEVLIAMTKLAIQSSGKLDILLQFSYAEILQSRQQTGKPPKPSWVPSFQLPTREEEDPEGAKVRMMLPDSTAYGTLDPFYRFLSGERVLHTRGACLGIVYKIAPPWHGSSTAFHEWVNPGPAITQYEKAGNYLIDAQRALGVPEENEAMNRFMLASMGSIESPYGRRRFGISESSTYMTLENGLVLPSPHTLQLVGLEHFGRRLFSFGPDRQFSKFRRGHRDLSVLDYGLADKKIAEGDRLCVLAGCHSPVILRRVRKRYILVGGAYAPGYMQGEAMRDIEAGGRPLEDFFIS